MMRVVDFRTTITMLSTVVVVVVLSSSSTTIRPTSAFAPSFPTTATRRTGGFSSSSATRSTPAGGDGGGGGGSSEELEKLRRKRQEIMTKRRAPADERLAASVKAASASSSSAAVDASSAPPSLERPEILRERLAAKEAREAEEAASGGGKGTKGKGGGKAGPVAAVDHTEDYDHENDLRVPNRVGFSTEAWGNPRKGFVRTKGKKKAPRGKFSVADLRAAYETLVGGGIRFVDSSEHHSATAESILGRLVEESRTGEEPVLASGLAPNPYRQFVRTRGRSGVRFGAAAVANALEASLARLETGDVELYQITPNSYSYLPGLGALLDGAVRALDRGSCNHVGVRDVYRPRALRSLARALETRGASLSTNSFELSLTNRRALRSGVVRACKDAGVVPVARNPLDGGLASGRYTANNPTGGEKGGRTPYSFKTLDPLMALHDAQARVADRVRDRLKKGDRERRARDHDAQTPTTREVTTTQVALAYVVAKGAVPVVPVNTKEEAEELLGCLGWQLTDEETALLDQAADLCGR